MVSYSPEDPSPSAPIGLPSVKSTEFEVVVPVLLRVRVKADDDLQAEVRSLEVVRSTVLSVPAHLQASVGFISFISPAVNGNFKPQAS